MNFYYYELVPRVNMHSMTLAYGDKNLSVILSLGEKVAHAVITNKNGYFYLEGQPVSEVEAIKRCWNIDHVIIEPSLKLKGKVVRLLSVRDGQTRIDNQCVDGISMTI